MIKYLLELEFDQITDHEFELLYVDETQCELFMSVTLSDMSVF